MKSKFFILIVIFSRLNFFGQVTFPSNGAPFNTHNTYAFINANIYVDYETVIKNGTLLIKDGLILTAAENVSVPKNAVVYDLKGKFIYPAFIDLFSDFGIVENKSNLNHAHIGPQMESNVKGAYGWNQAIKADFESHKNYISNK
jgi:imidazolonepropionase-like amidohydrolase